jgi:hypothetical protein
MDDFENRVNYAWPVTAVLSGMYQHFLSEVKAHDGDLRDRRLVIFGAGIRGCTLLLILEEYGFTNIVFCDNNPEKQKGRINKYPILSFQEALGFGGGQVFLLPIENGGAIREQMLNAGLREDKDFFYWDFQVYDEYIEEFKRPVKDHTLIVGDCAFSHIALKDNNKVSLGDMIKTYLGEENCKVLSMHGMGQRAFYNIIKTLISSRNEIPKRIIILIDLDVFTSKAHIMPRTQHCKLISGILESVSEPDKELVEYAMLTKERFDRFQVEAYTSYKNEGPDNIAKLYMKMNYMFQLKKSTESVLYLIKIIELMNDNNIQVTLHIPPVNYMLGEKFWGEEFTASYKSIFKDLWSFLQGLKYNVLDASFLISEQEFADVCTTDEVVNYQGRLKLMDFLIKSGVFKE